ncbi:hypothetical protein J1N35_013870 [Gossypium stocksii]|uniref:Uncharacterized protein n=1 Tax=Gossypium stocksii TaxID=47602 RepID=A0A9D4A8S4_9ROSI|nr:hypothetical protein J1N35_013870 [Gossypium stocksii]
MKFLPIHEPFFSSDTMDCLEYMSWFRVVGKLYLLSVEARSRQIRQKRQRRLPQQRRSRYGHMTSSLSALTKQVSPRSLHSTYSCYGDEDRDKAEGGNEYEDKDEGRDEDGYKYGGEDKNDGDDQVDVSTTLVIRGNQ